MLDFRRVSLIDASGAVVLQQLQRRLGDRGMAPILSGVSADNCHGRLLAQFGSDGFAAEHGKPDIDLAMEWAELRLLAQAGFEPLRETVPVEQVSRMEGLDAAQRTRLAACMQPRRVAARECLFRQGDPGDRLYIITSGSIDVISTHVPGSTALR